MKKIIRIPYLGTNDIDCILASWNVTAGESVTKGQVVCTLETTKTTFDIESDEAGFFYPLSDQGNTLKHHAPLGLLSDEIVDQPDQILSEIISQSEEKEKTLSPVMTKKAEILIVKNGLSQEQINQLYPGQKITEKLVEDFLLNHSPIHQTLKKGFTDLQRILIVGGVKGGGALILVDSLRGSRHQRVVGIVDQDVSFHGKHILGVPILGGVRMVTQWLSEGKADAVIISFNRDLLERQRVFDQFKSMGIPFCNVIDQDVEVRSSVSFGEGNVILGRTYIGACTQIGDNNFISAGVHLEHGNILGHHCAFGPGVYTSGNVTMGDRIRFGTGIHVEPDLNIGNDCIISSGCVIRTDIPESTSIKIHENTHMKINPKG